MVSGHYFIIVIFRSFLQFNYIKKYFNCAILPTKVLSSYNSTPLGKDEARRGGGGFFQNNPKQPLRKNACSDCALSAPQAQESRCSTLLFGSFLFFFFAFWESVSGRFSVKGRTVAFLQFLVHTWQTVGPYQPVKTSHIYHPVRTSILLLACPYQPTPLDGS